MTDKAKKAPKKEQQVTGIKAVLEQSLQSYEKLPMLEIIFDKFIRQLSTSLRNLTSEAVEVSIEDFTSLRFNNFFSQLNNQSSLIVFRAVEWENFGLLVLDNELIFSLIDILLGGKKNTVKEKKDEEGRALTSIEQGLTRQLSETILSELGQAFDHVSPTTFSFERLETNPNFVNIVRPGDAVITIKFKIEIEEQSKSFQVMIPYKTLEPVKEQMQQVFLGDKYGVDQEWERLMSTQVHNVNFNLQAVISHHPSTVAEIAKLKIGDTIVLNQKENDDIIVKCGKIKLFTGQIGKIDNKVAINIKNLVDR